MATLSLVMITVVVLRTEFLATVREGPRRADLASIVDNGAVVAGAVARRMNRTLERVGWKPMEGVMVRSYFFSCGGKVMFTTPDCPSI